MADKPETTTLSRAEFEELVIDYIYGEQLTTDQVRAMKATEEADNDCAELAVMLREAREMSSALPSVAPPLRLNQKILDMAAQEQHAGPLRFPKIVEPVGWLAAASLLLSCGYFLGMMTASTAVVQNQNPRQMAEDEEDPRLKKARTAVVGTAANLTSGVKMVFNKRHKTYEISFPGQGVRQGECAVWKNVKHLQCFLAQAENALNDDDVPMAYYNIKKARKKTMSGASNDGPMCIDKTYKQRVEKLYKDIQDQAKAKGLKLD